MNDITVALVQLNTTVGALTQNAASIAERARKAAAAGATVIVFPELALSGYPPEDLVLKQHFLEDCRDAAGELAARLPPDTTVIVGSPWPTANGGASNSAIVFAGGRIVGRYDKMVLPNYGVFDEKRVFQAGERAALLRLGDRQVGLHICEDSWDTGDRACASFSGCAWTR